MKVKPLIVQNSAVIRLQAVSLLSSELIPSWKSKCKIWVKLTSLCGVDFMQASCTARHAVWIFDFYWNWWLLKEPLLQG